MRIGYNTNGFAHHDLLTALELLAEIGYRSVAIKLRHGDSSGVRGAAWLWPKT